MRSHCFGLASAFTVRFALIPVPYVDSFSGLPKLISPFMWNTAAACYSVSLVSFTDSDSQNHRHKKNTYTNNEITRKQQKENTLQKQGNNNRANQYNANNATKTQMKNPESGRKNNTKRQNPRKYVAFAFISSYAPSSSPQMQQTSWTGSSWLASVRCSAVARCLLFSLGGSRCRPPRIALALSCMGSSRLMSALWTELACL